MTSPETQALHMLTKQEEKKEKEKDEAYYAIKIEELHAQEYLIGC